MRAQVAAVVAAIAFVTSGCATDAEPTDDATSQPPVTATPTPALSPTPSPSADVTVPPVRPEAMATPSADGAAAAASYFISLYPYVYATGDLTTWNELSAPDCVFCSSTRDGATTVQQNEGRVEGGSMTVESASGTEIDAGNWYSATVIATEAPSAEYDTTGTLLEESLGGTYQFSMALTFMSGSWRIDAVDVGPAQ